MESENETLLMFLRLWNVVVKGFEEPENEDKLKEAQEKFDALRMTNARAHSKIQNRVTIAIFHRVMRTTTAR